MPNKKNSVTLPVESATFDLSLILGAMRPAMKGLEQMATAREAAKVKCLAFADTVKAAFGTLDVLTASARKRDATDAHKAAYTSLKEAYLSELWGADFLAWVNGEGADKPRSPKKGQKAQPRAYWQQQKGAKWNKAGEGFVPRVLAFVEEDAQANAPQEEGQAKRAKPVDEACRDNVANAAKRMATAVKDNKDIPSHVNVAAFETFAALALDALEKGKVKRDRASKALDALRAAGFLTK